MKPLIGLRLSIARRAADMRVFHFGEVRTAHRGAVGQFALHVQLPWRIDGPYGIVTGRTDLRLLPSGGLPPDDWTYESGNLQDERIEPADWKTTRISYTLYAGAPSAAGAGALQGGATHIVHM